MAHQQSYRLGIDLGTNSIGVCVLDIKQQKDQSWEVVGIRKMIVRIFSDGRDPQSGASLAEARREPRQARRRRDRFLQRQKKLINALVRLGLFPADEPSRKKLEQLDPYLLRASALDQALPFHHLGRALFHLNQRRGFASNRKANAKDKEKTATKFGIEQLDIAMKDLSARTLGEFLLKKGRHDILSPQKAVPNGRQQLPIRMRSRVEKNKVHYDLYPSRKHYRDEFDQIWAKQSALNPKLTAEMGLELGNIIFHQRPLKPVRPGRCRFLTDQERMPCALPQFQEFRMWQEINNLGVVRDLIVHPLHDDPQQAAKMRRDLYEKLRRTKKMSFDAIRKFLQIDGDTSFNLESSIRDELLGDESGCILSATKYFGKKWWDKDEATRTQIIETLLAEEDEQKLFDCAVNEWGLDVEAAEEMVGLDLDMGHGSICREACAKILPLMRSGHPHDQKPWGHGLNYADATSSIYGSHSQFHTGEILPELPYYGVLLESHIGFGTGNPDDAEEKRLGKIANPTVHIGLNQLRKIINAIIKKYGHPTQIVVELARDLKMNKKQKDRLAKEQLENKKRKDRYREEIEELNRSSDGRAIKFSPTNYLKLRLWEELNTDNVSARLCPYSGKPISIRQLFSSEVEIEHILPFGRTWDNSPANKTVAYRTANRDKGNRTPYEAFHDRPGYHYELIQARANLMPKNKSWRFAADAMEKFGEESKLLDRQLNETRHLSRLTREYLGHICNPHQVWVVTGALTGLLRQKWGLNSLLDNQDDNRPRTVEELEQAAEKNRNNHLHHAVDAFAIGCTDRSILNRLSWAAGQDFETQNRFLEQMPPPFEDFDHHQLRQRLERVVVSHKPDVGFAIGQKTKGTTSAQLHEETAYGTARSLTRDDEKAEVLVNRKKLVDLKFTEFARVRDPKIREDLSAILAELRPLVAGMDKKAAEKELQKLVKPELVRYQQRTQVSRVRVEKFEDLTNTIALKDQEGKIYKRLIPGENHCIEIFQTPDGLWQGEGISVFAANQGLQTQWQKKYPEAKLVMRLHKGDMIELGPKGERQIYRVVQLRVGQGRLFLAGHRDAGELQKRHDDKSDPFRWHWPTYENLRQTNARKVFVDFLGQVKYAQN